MSENQQEGFSLGYHKHNPNEPKVSCYNTTVSKNPSLRELI